MDQSPDELSGREGETSEEKVDKISDEPMNSPGKQADAEDEGDNETGG